MVLGVGLVLSVPVEMNSYLRVGVGVWDVMVVCLTDGMRVRLMVVVVYIVGGIADMDVDCGVAAGVYADSMSVLMVECVSGVSVGFVMVVDGVFVRGVVDVVVVGFWFH